MWSLKDILKIKNK